jgi:predicted RNA binding protein YcfA (HicA-like mRNA interferase family)
MVRAGDRQVSGRARSASRELLVKLESDGWRTVRTCGSNRQLRHPTKRGAVTVAGKPSADVPRGTLSAILRQSSLKQ